MASLKRRLVIPPRVLVNVLLVPPFSFHAGNVVGRCLRSHGAVRCGDVAYRKLEMHMGAVIEGRLAHGEPETASVVELKRATGD